MLKLVRVVYLFINIRLSLLYKMKHGTEINKFNVSDCITYIIFRVRFASLPSVGLGLSGAGSDDPYKRKYSVALQVLKPFRPSSK